MRKEGAALEQDAHDALRYLGIPTHERENLMYKLT